MIRMSWTALGVMALSITAQAETLCFPLMAVPSRDLILQVSEKGCDRLFLESRVWEGHRGSFTPLIEKGWTVLRLTPRKDAKPVYVLSREKAQVAASSFHVSDARILSHGAFAFTGEMPLRIVVPDGEAASGVPSEEAWLVGRAISRLAGPWVSYETFSLPENDPGWTSWTGRKIGQFHVNVEAKAIGRVDTLEWLIY